MHLDWLKLRRNPHQTALPAITEDQRGQLRVLSGDGSSTADKLKWGRNSSGTNAFVELVTDADTQTLSNKTLTSPIVTDLANVQATAGEAVLIQKAAAGAKVLNVNTAAGFEALQLLNGASLQIYSGTYSGLVAQIAGATGALTLGAALRTRGAAPTAAANPATFGNTTAAATFDTNSNAVSGQLTFVTAGTGFGAGTYFTVTIPAKANTNYDVWLMPTSSDTRDLGVVSVTGRTTTTFAVQGNATPLVGRTYQWSYHIIERVA